MGYSESSKAYRIYIPGQRQIEISRDVVFEEEIAFQRSRKSQMEIDNETIPSPPSTVQRETNIILVDPVAPVIHQFAQDGFSEEPPENEQSVLIFANFRVQQVL
jgi:hypothetical protein